MSIFREVEKSLILGRANSHSNLIDQIFGNNELREIFFDEHFCAGKNNEIYVERWIETTDGKKGKTLNISARNIIFGISSLEYQNVCFICFLQVLNMRESAT